MNHIGHFVLVQTFLVAAIAGYWKWHRHPYLAPSLLVTASLLLGALLALVGQTYQTGANSWQLFFTWACLLIPWAIAAKSNAMWLLVLSLLNLSLYLWHVVNPGWPQDLWTNERSLMIWGMLFNAVAVAVWEAAASHSNSASSRWPMRLLGTLSALCAFWIAAQMIVEETILVIPLSLVTFWLASAFCFYRYLRLDMYFLSILAMWGTAIVGAATIYWSLDDFNLGGLLFSTMVILIMASFATSWLKQVRKEVNHDTE
ncbi:DUF2157 domain-containing protein [Veronia nyctiphanis]|nr:DUF2157 domain-containing protein [Veronia nyctiphanis]